MPEIELEGLGEPVLAQYLAALGIFRAIATQRDPEATLSFRYGVPRITSELDADAWVEWVMQEWRPSPIASPWNRGAGFHGSNKSVACTDKVKRHGVEMVLATNDPRLDGYRVVLEWLSEKLAAWGYADAPDEMQKARKPELLARLRSEAPDDWLPWLDAATVVEPNADGPPKPEYLALLGSGGNDGNLDLGNNYMLHLCNVVGFQGNLMKRPKGAAAWSARLLRGLLGQSVEGMLADSAGQLAPSSRKAPNGVSGTKSFFADKQLNPWLFLWAVEGTLLFAGASTRRLGSHGRARAAFPFHAERVDAGYGTAADVEKGKDELWLPAWDSALTYRETHQLFGEARAQVGRRRASSGLDYARAVGGLAATRGVHRFLRFAIVERAGQSNIAIHVGTFASGKSKPLDRLRRLDPYLQSFRQLANKKNVPARFSSAWRGFEGAVLDVARRGHDPGSVTALLAAIGRLRREEAKGLPADTTLRRFVLDDSDGEWLDDADRSDELLVAASLATLSAKAGYGPLASYLWREHSNARLMAREAARLDLLALLEALLDRRLLEHRDPQPGAEPARPMEARAPIGADTLLALQRGDLEDERALDLLWLFSSLDAETIARRIAAPRGGRSPELSRTWMLARLGVEGALPRDGSGRNRWVPTRPALEVVHAYRADNPELLIRRAAHVLRAAAGAARPITPTRLGPRGERRRLAASLALPLSRELLRWFTSELLPSFPSTQSQNASETP